LLELTFNDIESSVVVEVKKYEDEFYKKIPFKSTASVWKHEVYFSTPIKIDCKQCEKVYKVYRGGVYYWPPGNALCLFYGLTHAYTPVIYIGDIVDPVQILHYVKNGFKVSVSEHTLDLKFKDVVDTLKSLGYTVATPIRNNEKVVTAYKYRNRKRISFQIYVEDYGFHIESEGVVKFREDDLTTYMRLLEYKDSITGYARLDLSEEGFVVISATVDSISELSKAVIDVEKNLENIEFLSRV
jgi:hypothetical protein